LNKVGHDIGKKARVADELFQKADDTMRISRSFIWLRDIDITRNR
jgi:hypothetical protein